MKTKQQPKHLPPATIKKTLKDLHQELKDVPKARQQQVLSALSLNSHASFYDILNGIKILNPAEKKVIAEIYNKTVDEIDWQDPEKLIA